MLSITSALLIMAISMPLTPRASLIEGQGIVESGLNRFAVGKAGEKGIWQVQKRFWGEVPRDVSGQLKQHNRIMDSLMKANNGNLEIAITRYNGRGKKAKAYYAKVRKKTIEVELIGV